MSSANSTSGSSGGGGGSLSDTLTVVALVISVVALVTSTAQAAQQYYASASGYSNCGEKVMGEWSLTKKRKFRLTELRFEVQFEAPILLVAPPTNKRGPVENQVPMYINGTPESYKEIRILPPEEDKMRQKSLSEKDRIHTADNEHATWITLLSALQRMEAESMKWEREEYAKKPPRDGPLLNPPDFSKHTLAVGVQRKKRSWDSMPDSVKKPYATTTICHIIEMTAMLGMVWVEFDRRSDRYRAEGNGYIMTGSNIQDLGIMFTIQICGKNKFQENRIIPVDEVKELCFGFVPTIFRGQTDVRRLDFPVDESRDLSTMQLSGREGIAETLVVIGCNATTINYFLRSNNQSHLFPLAFEILGMLARTMHIEGSRFRMLPNPTPYNWDHKYFSLEGLLLSYYKCLAEKKLKRTEHLETVQCLAEKIKDILKEKDRFEGQITITLLNELHNALNETDLFLKKKVPREKVLHVLRGHIQEVLSLIKSSNGEGEANEEQLSQNFTELNSSPPEHKQDLFINIYFDVVLPNVLTQVPSATKSPSTSILPLLASNSNVNVADDKPETIETRDALATDIWCTLVFRMLCWLLLHDFHRADAQFYPKSELLGSRLPVFIS